MAATENNGAGGAEEQKGKSRLSGYGGGDVSTVLSVDEVAREAREPLDADENAGTQTPTLSMNSNLDDAMARYTTLTDVTKQASGEALGRAMARDGLDE